METIPRQHIAVWQQNGSGVQFFCAGKHHRAALEKALVR